MGKQAALFPGQGAQSVGMGAAACKASPAARDIFDEANDALGFDIAQACFEGPADRLKETEVQQLAILTATMAAVEAWRAEIGNDSPVDACAGLSLGEYAALTFAGAISFGDAVRLVQKRGRFMHEAAELNPGTMASIIGMSPEQLEPIIEQAAAKGSVVAANFNSPAQIVVSGVEDAIDELCTLASAAGAKRCIKLSVSGAFHSPLMQPASDKLAEELAAVEINEPRIPVIANVTAKPVTQPDEIRELLVRQLTSPVLWVQSMTALIGRGYDSFVEIGPGKVLSGLMRRTDRSVEMNNYSA